MKDANQDENSKYKICLDLWAFDLIHGEAKSLKYAGEVWYGVV